MKTYLDRGGSCANYPQITQEQHRGSFLGLNDQAIIGPLVRKLLGSLEKTSGIDRVNFFYSRSCRMYLEVECKV